MRIHLATDNGAPCWKCQKTVHFYAVDDAVSYVTATCMVCGSDNMFHPPEPCSTSDDPKRIAALHRQSLNGKHP